MTNPVMETSSKLNHWRTVVYNCVAPEISNLCILKTEELPQASVKESTLDENALAAETALKLGKTQTRKST